MSYIPDNYDRWEMHDAEQERKLSMRPKCDKCKEPIQDEECYEINGKYICENCMEMHRVYVEDLM